MKHLKRTISVARYCLGACFRTHPSQGKVFSLAKPMGEWSVQLNNSAAPLRGVVLKIRMLTTPKHTPPTIAYALKPRHAVQQRIAGNTTQRFLSVVASNKCFQPALCILRLQLPIAPAAYIYIPRPPPAPPRAGRAQLWATTRATGHATQHILPHSSATRWQLPNAITHNLIILLPPLRKPPVPLPQCPSPGAPTQQQTAC